jgi:molecular chaperone GrpE
MTQDIAEEEKSPLEEASVSNEPGLDPITDLQTQVEAEKDKALRAFAELENFKRRKEQEVDQFKKYAHEKVILELLPVLDSFDRACEHLPLENEELKKQLEGFLLIQKQFHSILDKSGITAIETIGCKFDPNLHQAVLEEESDSVEAGCVTKEFQKGYRLYDKVIRPSMVVVAK